MKVITFYTQPHKYVLALDSESAEELAFHFDFQGPCLGYDCEHYSGLNEFFEANPTIDLKNIYYSDMYMNWETESELLDETCEFGSMWYGDLI